MDFRLKNYSKCSADGKRMDILPFLDQSMAKGHADPISMDARSNVLTICDYIITENSGTRLRTRRFPDEAVGRAIAVITSLGGLVDRIERAVKCVSENGKLPLAAFFALGTSTQDSFALLRPM